MWETKLNASRAVQTAEDSSASVNRLPIHNTKDSTQSSNSAADSKQPSIHHVDPTRAALQALPPSMYKATSGTSSAAINQDIKPRHHLGAQIDGGVDGSSSEDDEDDDEIIGVEHGDDDDLNDDDDDDKTNNDDQSEHGKEDPEPLNSEDDLTNSPGSNNSNSDLFDTENVIVCQYDKITRIKNKWKFHLKDGIMNINGKDYLFSKANGDAEW
jgi:transcription initiation factor TFIIA large subunit